MSKIQNLSEPWDGHTFAEVQEFIKENFKYQPASPQPEAVNLGLPSGTKWADRNVGATSPEDFGLYFSWGNVDGHRAVYNSNNSKWEIEDGYNFDGTFSNNNWTGSYGKTLGSALTSSIVAGAAAYDAARANLGSPWKMPTNTQIQELIDNTTQSIIKRNGVIGMLFTSTINYGSVFFPLAGYAYKDDLDNVGRESSGSTSGGGSGYDGFGGFYSVNVYNGGEAYILDIDGMNSSASSDHFSKYLGLPVRAVQ